MKYTKKDIEKALIFATACHAGQVRKVSGEKYMNHPERVSERVKTDFQYDRRDKG